MADKKKFEAKLWMQARYGLLLLGVVGFFFLLFVARGALLPVAIGWFLAYVLNPIIDWMERRRISRGLAIAFLLGITVIVLGVVFTLLIPYFGREMIRLSANLFAQMKVLLEWLKESYGVQIPSSLEETIDTYGTKLQEIAPGVAGWLGGHLSGVFSQLGAVLGALLNAILIPVFAYYFLLDFHTIDEKFLSLIPHGYKHWIRHFIDKVDEMLKGFIYGQLLVGLAQGVLFAIGLTLLGIDFGAVIGIMAGLFAIIPYLGYIVGISLSLLMALLALKSWAIMLGILGLFFGVNLLEGLVLTPKLVGDKVGLPPVAVIIAVIFFSELLGFLGLVIAVPTTAVLRMLWQELEAKYRNSDFFLKGSAPLAPLEDVQQIEHTLTTIGCSCGGTLTKVKSAPIEPPKAGAQLRLFCSQCGKEASLRFEVRLIDPNAPNPDASSNNHQATASSPSVPAVTPPPEASPAPVTPAPPEAPPTEDPKNNP